MKTFKKTSTLVTVLTLTFKEVHRGMSLTVKCNEELLFKYFSKAIVDIYAQQQYTSKCINKENT